MLIPSNLMNLEACSNITRNSDLPTAPEPKWLGGCIRRNPRIPPISEPDWPGRCVERHSELPLGQPCTEDLLDKFFPVPSLPPPDITQGLGKHQVKRELVQLERYAAAKLPLMVYRDELYLYKPPCWRKLSGNQGMAEVRALLERTLQDDCLTRREYQEIYRSLLVNPDLRIEEELTPPEDMINMLDGTYDLRSGRLLPHNKEDHFLTCINVRGREMEYCKGSVFEAFVENCSNGDPLVREQLLQLIALTALRKPLKHFYVLLGESNTGKTQYGRFLEELVGRENVASIRGVQDFADRWTVGSLEGKLLATCLDLPDKPLPSTAVSTIKQFVGDDPIKGERKYGAPFTFYQKPLLLFAGNHPIQIPNMAKERALMNRMIVIPFRNPVPESSMHQELYRELLQESPYILREALAVYCELEQRAFQLTQASLPPELLPRDSRAGFRAVGLFLEYGCTLDANAQTATKALYDAYCAYVGPDANPLSRIEFSRQLSEHLASCPDVESLKRVNGTDERGYRGIRIK